MPHRVLAKQHLDCNYFLITIHNYFCINNFFIDGFYMDDLIREKIDSVKTEVIQTFYTKSGSHDWDHTERVCNMCLCIGKIEKANLVVLELAALMHDIGREEQDKSKGALCHAEVGAKLAVPILEKHGFSKEIVDRVVHCIATHRFRKGNAPESLEAKILFDADKLDCIGAIGIARAIYFSAEHGAKIHNHNHSNIHETSEYSNEDTAYREFSVKLKKVKEKMLTNEGKKLAEHRHRVMETFFEELNDEVDGKK
jgi:uncharacterized protein